MDVLENDGRGLESHVGSARRHRQALEGQARRAGRRRPRKRAGTLEGQIARVADIIAYVNHDIDDAIRAGLLKEADLPAAAVGTSSGTPRPSASAAWCPTSCTRPFASSDARSRCRRRFSTRCSTLREFLFGAVYENEASTAEFQKAHGILGGLVGEGRARPAEFLDRPDPGAARARTPPFVISSPG